VDSAFIQRGDARIARGTREGFGAALSYLVNAIRTVSWSIGNLLRRLRRPPEFVAFTLSGAYSEYHQPAGSFVMRQLRRPKLSLQELAEQLRTIAEDRRVRGVVLHLRPLEMQQAGVESLRDLLLELREAGKRVVAWATYYTATSYLVACAADEILMQPAGSIGPLGTSQTYSFLAEALEKVGMQADLLAISPYKTAADTLTRKAMSDEAREMANWLIDSGYAERLTMIQDGRGWEPEQANELIDASPLTDVRALEVNAVDALVTEEQLPRHLGTEVRPATMADWAQARRSLRRRSPVRSGRYVALIAIEGIIIDGESARPPIKLPIPVPILLDPRAGDLSVVQVARRAASDKRAAAVVLYVNSRGGAATASEAMTAALEKIDPIKPLIVSMGPVAASGGYHVATAGRRIFAQPSTVTGSIGVYGGKVVAGGLLDKLLLGREIIARGAHTLIYDDEQPFTREQREIVLSFIRRSYELFLQAVGKSRGLSVYEVDAIGGGRVWTGRQALENGLVDELGGLEKALASARQLAGLDPRAPVRLITAGKRSIAPSAQPAAALDYALEGLRMFQPARALRLSPLIAEEHVP
jgi:protease-4